MDTLVQDIVIFGGVLLILIIIFFALNDSGNSQKYKSRLKRVKTQTLQEKIEEKQLSLRRNKDTSLNQFGLEKMGKRLSVRLQTANITLTVKQFIMRSLGAAIILSLLLAVFAKQGFIFALLMGFAMGFGLPHFYVSRRIKKTHKKFLLLFPDAIELIVRGLRAGLPVTESMMTVAKEIPDPVGPIFGEISDQIRLGVPAEKAMADMARSLNMTEFDFFVISVTLQRETGGNLGEILSNLAEVLRSRHMLKLKIKAMSSEARASAMIVGSLPFFVLAALMFMSPDYLSPMIEDYRGNIAALGALCSLATGVFVMTKMTQFRI